MFRSVLSLVALALVFLTPRLACAQGNIFGTVENTDGTNPAAGDLFWIGFLDDTDEEIRIESNTGAGYDGLNWFDDFQNYTTEGAGNPYDYFHVNTASGQAFHLSGLIPSNSFHQENITLAAATIPTRPTGLSGTVSSPTMIHLTWDAVAGLTYHVYRRVTANNSVFRRLDDPTGNLANPGVAGGSFDDATSDGVSIYTYLLVAEDETGTYSAHSTEFTIDASESACACDCHSDPNCDGVVNVIDVVRVTEIAFRGGADVPDPNASCPVTTTDVDCSGFTNVIDAVRIVDVAFRGGNPADSFCDPCAP